jgi:hypothetical protein
LRQRQRLALVAGGRVGDRPAFPAQCAHAIVRSAMGGTMVDGICTLRFPFLTRLAAAVALHLSFAAPDGAPAPQGYP